MSIAEITEAISGFYLDPTNAATPIGDLLLVLKKKAEGETGTQTEKRLADLRKSFVESQ